MLSIVAALAGLLGSALPGTTAATSGAEPTGQFVWFGTYTGGPANSEGIYVSQFDATTGKLTAPTLAAAVKNPSFLAVHPTLPVMYAVSEVADADGKPTGAVLALAIDEATGTLTTKNHQSSGGGGPCHVSVDRSGKVALAANYGGGSVICLGLSADVTDTNGFSTAEIVAHPTGKFLYASNRGHDSIAMYAVDQATGRLTFLGAEPTRCKTPRNFVIDPTGKFLLAAGQNSHTVTVFAIDVETGKLIYTGQSLDVPSPVCIRFRPTR